jgi:hypothetical protein
MIKKRSNNKISDGEITPVQDSAREDQLASLFNLRKNPNRLGPDAFDEKDNPFELKTTTQNSVGTGRDVSIGMIQGWRQRYWIVAKGLNLKSGFEPEAIYFLDPQMMDKALAKIEEHIKPDIHLGDKALPHLEGKLNTHEIDRLRYLINRGSTLNNPKIPWHYVEENGVQISKDHAKQLRKLVEQHPLKKEKPRSVSKIIQKVIINSLK